MLNKKKDYWRILTIIWEIWKHTEVILDFVWPFKMFLSSTASKAIKFCFHKDKRKRAFVDSVLNEKKTKYTYRSYTHADFLSNPMNGFLLMLILIAEFPWKRKNANNDSNLISNWLGAMQFVLLIYCIYTVKHDEFCVLCSLPYKIFN